MHATLTELTDYMQTRQLARLWLKSAHEGVQQGFDGRIQMIEAISTRWYPTLLAAPKQVASNDRQGQNYVHVRRFGHSLVVLGHLSADLAPPLQGLAALVAARLAQGDNLLLCGPTLAAWRLALGWMLHVRHAGVICPQPFGWPTTVTRLQDSAHAAWWAPQVISLLGVSGREVARWLPEHNGIIAHLPSQHVQQALLRFERFVKPSHAGTLAVLAGIQLVGVAQFSADYRPYLAELLAVRVGASGYQMHPLHAETSAAVSPPSKPLANETMVEVDPGWELQTRQPAASLAAALSDDDELASEFGLEPPPSPKWLGDQT